MAESDILFYPCKLKLKVDNNLTENLSTIKIWNLLHMIEINSSNVVSIT